MWTMKKIYESFACVSKSGRSDSSLVSNSFFGARKSLPCCFGLLNMYAVGICIQQCNGWYIRSLWHSWYIFGRTMKEKLERIEKDVSRSTLAEDGIFRDQRILESTTMDGLWWWRCISMTLFIVSEEHCHLRETNLYAFSVIALSELEPVVGVIWHYKYDAFSP